MFLIYNEMFLIYDKMFLVYDKMFLIYDKMFLNFFLNVEQNFFKISGGGYAPPWIAQGGASVPSPPPPRSAADQDS